MVVRRIGLLHVNSAPRDGDTGEMTIINNFVRRLTVTQLVSVSGEVETTQVGGRRPGLRPGGRDDTRRLRSAAQWPLPLPRSTQTPFLR